MNKKISILDLYSKFFFYFSKKQKIRTIFAFFLGIFSSFLELISVGLIVPFVLLITNPEKIYEFSLYKTIVGEKIFLINELVLLSIVFFISIVIISTFLKLVHLKLNCLVSFDIMRTFGDILFKKLINQEYQDFNKHNTKDIVTTLTLRCQSTGEANFNIVLIVGSLITTIVLMTNIFFFVSYKIVLVLFIIFLFYILFWIVIKKKINNSSKIFSTNYQKLNKSVDEMMRSYSDLVLYNLNDYFFNEFQKNNYFLRKSQARVTFLGGYPSIIIQMVIILGFICLIFIWNKSLDLKNQIPFFALLILTIQRTIPNLQTIFTGYVNLSYHKENLQKILPLLSLSNEYTSLKNHVECNNLSNENFNKINIKNVKFTYPDFRNNELLFDINLEINKGEKIALVGESGSGKSTLVKIILGLIKPTDGNIFINDKKLEYNLQKWWNSNVAYIPQKIFILFINYLNSFLDTNLILK